MVTLIIISWHALNKRQVFISRHSKSKRLISQEMDWKLCLFLLWVFPVVTSTNLHPRFWKAVNHLSDSLRAKIVFGLGKSNLYLRTIKEDKEDKYQNGCYKSLLHIMRGALKCPTTANAISPLLDVIEFRYNMFRDERIVQSFYTDNCTWLDSKSRIICEQENVDVEYKIFVKMIDDCHSEQWEAGARGNVSLSKKLRFVILSKFSVFM